MLPNDVRRPFTVFDALVSTAAMGLALAWSRVTTTHLWAILRDIPFWGASGWAGIQAYLKTPGVMRTIVELSFLSMDALLWSWMLAFLMMRMKSPRPPYRRLVRQPAMAACGVFLLGLVVLPGIGLLGNPALVGVAYFSIRCAIPIVWIILALRGLWEEAPDWIERLGRGLVVCYLVMLPLEFTYPVIFSCLPV